MRPLETGWLSHSFRVWSAFATWQDAGCGLGKVRAQEGPRSGAFPPLLSSCLEKGSRALEAHGEPEWSSRSQCQSAQGRMGRCGRLPGGGSQRSSLSTPGLFLPQDLSTCHSSVWDFLFWVSCGWLLCILWILAQLSPPQRQSGHGQFCCPLYCISYLFFPYSSQLYLKAVCLFLSLGAWNCISS